MHTTVDSNGKPDRPLKYPPGDPRNTVSHLDPDDEHVPPHRRKTGLGNAGREEKDPRREEDNDYDE